MSGFSFSTTSEEVVTAFSSNITGRTFLITGSTAKGLGAQCALALATQKPAHIILVSRNQAKCQPVIDEIATIDPAVKVSFVTCELSDFDDVRRAAKEISSLTEKVDVVLNNAGIMAQPYAADKQGNEMTLSSNHLGHFLMTNLLFPLIKAAGPKARVVNVTSNGHRCGPFRLEDYNFKGGETYQRWSAYAQSKTANMLFSVGLASRGILSFSAHPGAIWGTSLGTHLTMDDFVEIEEVTIGNNGSNTFGKLEEPKTLSQGAAPLLVAAIDPHIEGESGAYVENCQVGKPEPYAVDKEIAEKLWKISEEVVGQKFDLYV